MMNSRARLTAVWIFLLTGITLAAGQQRQSAQAGSPSPRVQTTSSAASPQRALLDRYCVTCHNQRLKTAGLTLDTMDVTHVGARPDVWEKVVRKLRAGFMPPIGMPRPDKTTYDGFASWLETELDRSAVAAPNPGRPPTFHRLNRTEYRNALRDLFALEDLPKEFEVAALLPADDASNGFDNMADALRVSPVLMERYVAAARKVSRLALGDPAIPVVVDVYQLPLNLQQNDRYTDDLPFGTRGGTVIRRQFPLDGEYIIKIQLEGDVREPHRLEVSIDGEQVKLITLEPPKEPRPAGNQQVEEPKQFEEVRLPIKAGARVVTTTFLEDNSAPGTDLVRPFRRGRGQLPSVASVTISGPYSPSGAGDTASRRRILACHPARSSEEATCARQILSTLARRAYRRPINDSDLQTLLHFYAEGRASASNEGRSSATFEAGIERALERMLVSPQFLFRVEHDPAAVPPNTSYRISDLDLASRLSFFLWSSIPDDELLDVASRGGLKNPAVLERQARRMLADPRSAALVTNFAGQWLYLRDLMESAKPDERLFPDFDENLREAFRRETELFFESILREDRSVFDLLRANHTFVNERLAKHYGIPNVTGSRFRRVTLPEDSPRRGLLGQGSILTVTSYANRTSPVVRGKWILDNLLSVPPPPPPPNVPALKPTGSDGKALSMRAAIALHRANPVCASCHSMMDPLGLSLENFDAVGRWRTRGESNAPIDASSVFPDGTKFDGVAGLRETLLAHPEQFVTTVTEKLLMYGLGRGLEYYDGPAVRAIRNEAARSDYRLSALIMGVIKSSPFQMRRSS